jgi:hypothetical protein
MTKSLILYGARTKLTDAHKPVHSNNGKQSKYYVRMQQVNKNIDDALDAAKPMAGETVLNSIPIEI